MIEWDTATSDAKLCGYQSSLVPESFPPVVHVPGHMVISPWFFFPHYRPPSTGDHTNYLPPQTNKPHGNPATFRPRMGNDMLS
jgi:hypothetical protein